jgi:hypothetical protein
VAVLRVGDSCVLQTDDLARRTSADRAIQASASVFLRRRSAIPAAPKPAIISAQVAGSGNGALSLMKM